MPETRNLSLAWLALAPVSGMLANVCLQLVLARLPLGIGHVKRQFMSFGAGGLVATGLTIYGLIHLRLPPIDRVGYFALHAGAYACAGFVFFNLINANISSLRVRMVKEYHTRYPRLLSDEELMSRYNAEEMLAARLERLVAGSQIRAAGDRYYPQRKLVWVINRFFSGLRRLLLK